MDEGGDSAQILKPCNDTAGAGAARHVNKGMVVVVKTQHHGAPDLEQWRRIRGACQFFDNAKGYQNPGYEEELADGEVDVRITALMRAGTPEKPSSEPRRLPAPTAAFRCQEAKFDC